MIESRPAPERGGRRTQIVEAAYRRLASSGFEGLRTRDVAAEAGINVATLHYHFPTKETLIRAVVGHALGRFTSTLGGEGDRRAQLRAHFRGLRRLLRDEPQLPLVMGELYMRAGRDEGIGELIAGADRAWHAWLVNLLEDQPNPEGKALVIQATLRGVFMVPGGKAGGERLDRALAALEELLVG